MKLKNPIPISSFTSSFYRTYEGLKHFPLPLSPAISKCGFYRTYEGLKQTRPF
ncbi:hypothetical protein B4113_2027 [Geobacillus sp. B4113_201601]|nr:hypothetical protein B4113_2027 [Geobacillus sp. B4113_201601]